MVITITTEPRSTRSPSGASASAIGPESTSGSGADSGAADWVTPLCSPPAPPPTRRGGTRDYRIAGPGTVGTDRCRNATDGGTLVTTLENRPNTALVVIDVQNGVVAGDHDRDAVVGRSPASSTGRGARTCRWCGCSTPTTTWRRAATSGASCPSSIPADDEPLVAKNYGDAFEDTNLEDVLAELGVGRLVVTGAQTDAACARRSTVRSCAATTPPSSATPTPPRTSPSTGAPPPDQVIAHTNLYWSFQTAPGRSAGTVATADVDFAGPS